MSATFSVLIAAYNQARYILETLDSVTAQSCADWELVVVDDGSTDDTREVVSGWIARLSRPNRVVFVSTENGGQSAALEHGFALCEGRYVVLLDSDDRLLPSKLAEVLRAVTADPAAGMIVHPLYVMDEEGRRTGDVRPMRAKLSEGDLREQVSRTTRHVAPATSGVVIRADVFRQLLPMATRPFRDAADAYLTMGASLLAPVRALQEPLGEYRMHAEGNYLKRFATAEGLRYTVKLEHTIVSHFGLERAAEMNTYFARNAFALEKLAGTPASRLRAYRRLMRSTLADPSFSARDRVLLVGFWTACMAAPRPAFARLWEAFQRKHTGIDRIIRARESSAAAPSRAVVAAPSGS
ncbi:MAG TPA: glycosyltransferase [Longimicrobium sp.]